MSAENKMLKTAGFMAIATFLAKACGLVRESMITAFFGVGNTVDAYFAASQLPTTLFDMVIGGVISASFIPVFNSIYEKENKENAMTFANKFIGMILLATVLLSVVGIVFSEQLVTGIIAPEFTGETAALAAKLSSIMFPMVIFTGLAFSFVGILQSFGEFNIPAIMSLVSNVAVILYFPLFGKRFGIYGLAVAILFSWSLQVMIQIPSLRKMEYKFRPSIDFKDKYIRQAISLALPMLISTWVQPLYSLVNTRIASGADGVVSVLNCSNRLYLVMTGVFSFVVTNLIFPKLSRTNAAERTDESKSIVVGSLKAITLVIVPVMVCFILLSKDVIGVIYEHGKFTHDKTLVTAMALSCYSVGMIGLAYNEIMTKTFFSMKNSKTPMVNALISMAANVVMAYLFYERIGVGGLALATAGGSVVNAALNFIAYRTKQGKLFEREDLSDIVKTFLAGVIMAGIVLALSTFTDKLIVQNTVGYIIHGALCGGIGLCVYLILVYVIGVKCFKNAVGGVLRDKK
ncbi:MAG: murein biosynthesis integral membrane protein MurJ [Eubacteriales bacterium]|nr:murein biosynthesis integral membrane protein MurJ [Eubacteriales bacterium]